MRKLWIRGFPLLLGGLILFSACPTDSNDPVTGTGWGPDALTYNNNTGDWEDVDVVSGASLLRLDNTTFVYADNGGSTLKTVDVLDPTVALASAEVGYPAAIIQASKEGNIAVIAGNIPAEGIQGIRVKVYNRNLNLVMDKPYGKWQEGGKNDFGTLYFELSGSALAVGDKYVVIIWTDNEDTWRTPPATSGGGGGGGGSSTPAPGTATATYVGIYDIGSGESEHFKMTQKGDKAGTTDDGVEYYNTVTPNNVLAQSGIGSPGSLATRGDYVLVGSGTGTAAFKIGANFELTNVTPGSASNDGKRSHWMLDNGEYVMDCANLSIKAWKWNGSTAPSVKLIDGLGERASQNRGYVRVVCFDQEDGSKAYVCVKNSPATPAATGIPEKPNGFYSLDLAAGTKEFLFLPVFKNDDGTTYALSPWGLERFKKGEDVWYVLTGGSVEAFKNPPKQTETEANVPIAPDWHLELDSAVHIAKAFNVGGRYFVAVKSGTVEDFPPESALVLHEID
jgi:hypothetical protein